MKASGSGVLAIASYGSIHKYTLLDRERRLVDNGHLVAWTASMGLRTKMASSSVWGSISSGEGLMCEFTGPGIIYLQSHKPRLKDGDNSKPRNSSGISLFFGLILFIILSFFTFIFIYLIMDFLKEDPYSNKMIREF